MPHVAELMQEIRVMNTHEAAALRVSACIIGSLPTRTGLYSDFVRLPRVSITFVS